ncbi:MAG: SdrD B-like domain-containing protein, partial [Saprospiraceae bacterium]
DFMGTSITNNAEIEDAEDVDGDNPMDEDSTPGDEDGTTPDTPNDDLDDTTGGDDYDPETIVVEQSFDLALTKTVSNPAGTEYGQGSTVTYDVTIYNQGTLDAYDVDINDYFNASELNFVSITAPAMSVDGNAVSVVGAGPNIELEQIAAGDEVVISYEFTIDAGFQGTNIVNNAEIVDATDTDGGTTTTDEDSPLTETNDGSTNELTSDNDVNDDSTGGTDNAGDEDDYDPAEITIGQTFDLALIKTMGSPTDSPITPGSTVTFDIAVTNQGTVDAYNVQINDYIPTGLTLNDANWTATGGVATLNTEIPQINSGATMTRSITFTVDADFQGTSITNNAEIESAEDVDGNNPPDEDSTPNDEDGTTPDTPNDDIDDEDGGDDYDPETITIGQIFDLALIKTIGQPTDNPLFLGGTVSFDIEVFNQGTLDAYNVQVNDYIPTGLTLADANWTETAGVANLNTPIAEILKGASQTVTISFTVDDDFTGDMITNNAEIADAEDVNGDHPQDTDSTPNTEDGVTPDGIDNDTLQVDGSDDYDPALIAITQLSSIGDTVWIDENINGIQDPNEVGVEGVIVNVLDTDGNIVGTDTTDANGYYIVDDLIPGDYQVQFVLSSLPVGTTLTIQDAGSDDAIDSDADADGFTVFTTLEPGEHDPTWDAGIFVQTMNIGDFVWHDQDGDGHQDANEPPIEGVMVILYDENDNIIMITETDNTGHYIFEDVLPGTYYIVFVDPDGFEITIPDSTGDETDSDVTNSVDSDAGSTTDMFTLVLGQEDDYSFDAGYYMCIPIGELVWYDINENDIWDSEENGINGLEVNLYQLQNGSYVLYESTLTGHKPGTPSDDGYFKFCAPPGTYYIEVMMPPIGLVQTNPNIFNNLPITNSNESTADSDLTNNYGAATTTSFTVKSGDQICNIGAGFYPMATVGNKVWYDANENGIQESNESSVSNVLVQAFEVETGQAIAQSYTDAGGIYKIEYLQKKDYYLKFTPPSGYSFTTANSGNELVDSDVDHTYGYRTTAAYSLEPGQNYINIDAGLILGVLPVEWLAINAKVFDEDVKVTWSTALEVNSDYFIVERKHESENGFIQIGRVNAAMNSETRQDYSLLDTEVNAGRYYYRILQLDNDGNQSYSEIVSVNISHDKSFNYYPNPTSGLINYSINLKEGSQLIIDIYDSSNRLVAKSLVNKYIEKGYHESFIDLSNFDTGVYTMRLLIEDKVIHKQVILVK